MAWLLFMYFCDVCEKTVTEWLPLGKRGNVRCPHCFSLERHRLAMIYLKTFKKQFENLLHFAPEKWMQIEFLKISKNYICCDIDPDRYKGKDSVQPYFVDATNIQFPDNFFSCIYASHILEHIIEDRKAMSEILRTLKNGGELLALVPQRMSLTVTYEDFSIVEPKEREKHFGQNDHVRFYGKDFSKRLKDSGFYVEAYYLNPVESDVNEMDLDKKINLNKFLDLPYIKSDNIPSYCGTSKNLNHRDILYVCKKIS